MLEVESSLSSPVYCLMYHEPIKNINNHILSGFQRLQTQSHDLSQAWNLEILSLH